MKGRIAFILVFGLSNWCCCAQDTIYFRSNEIQRLWVVNQNGYLLQNENISAQGVYTLLENIFKSLPANKRSCNKDTCTFNNQVLISNCTFNNLKTFYTKLYFPTANIDNFKSNASFSFDSCILKGEPDISNFAGNNEKFIAFNHSAFETIYLTHSTGQFSFFDNLLDGINADRCVFYQFTLNGNNFTQTDTAKIKMINSSVSNFNCDGNNIKNLFCQFSFDTLNADFDVNRIDVNRRKQDSGGFAKIIFENCFINSNFSVFKSSKKISIHFINCIFGKNVNLSNLNIEDLLFDNCRDFQEQIDLNTIKSENLNISFVNTELKDFRLNYLGKFKLFFPTGTKQEYVISTYENMLAKFKLEGKLESFHNVDIEYTQYKNSLEGIWGLITDFLSRIWWYYGYRKFYILYWTFGFLLLFYFLNLTWWKEMQNVYPIIPEEEKSYYESVNVNRKDKLRLWLNIFVFTAYIFFSLRVDFGKLSYKNSKLLTYFFVQYIIGLFCVFFIANAILKI